MHTFFPLSKNKSRTFNVSLASFKQRTKYLKFYGKEKVTLEHHNQLYNQAAWTRFLFVFTKKSLAKTLKWHKIYSFIPFHHNQWTLWPTPDSSTDLRFKLSSKHSNTSSDAVTTLPTWNVKIQTLFVFIITSWQKY